jgi:hypothetical protein
MDIYVSIYFLLMEQTEKTLDKIYEKDKTTGAYVISVAIDKYTDIFNEWDPAPFRKRDIDQDLRYFLEDCSSDIPIKNDVSLNFDVLDETRDTEKETRIKLGLKTYFSFVRNLLERKIKKSYQTSLLYVLASFFLLAASFLLRTVTPDGLLFVITVEGINIGGWVFLWEAISTFVFKNRGVKNQYLQYQRLSCAPVLFKYNTKS